MYACISQNCILKTVSLDYIPEPASSVPIKKPPAAGTSTLEVMADVHQRFGNVDSGSGEVEVLERTQEGNQVTQFQDTVLRNARIHLHVVYRSTFK